LAVFACLPLVCARLYAREKARLRQEIEDALHTLVTSPDADTPSPLAVVADQVALLLAARLMQQVKTMLAGTESGLAKGESAQLAMQLAESGPPWMAALAGILPKRLRNQFLRNPAMVGALGKLAQGAGGADGNGNHGSSAGGDVRERMRRQG